MPFSTMLPWWCRLPRHVSYTWLDHRASELAITDPLLICGLFILFGYTTGPVDWALWALGLNRFCEMLVHCYIRADVRHYRKVRGVVAETV